MEGLLEPEKPPDPPGRDSFKDTGGLPKTPSLDEEVTAATAGVNIEVCVTHMLVSCSPQCYRIHLQILRCCRYGIQRDGSKRRRTEEAEELAVSVAAKP